MLGVLELQVLELLAELPRLQAATEEAAAWPRAGFYKGSLRSSVFGAAFFSRGLGASFLEG